MDPTDLAFAGAARHADLVRERQVTPRELVELFLGRIQRLDGELGAFRTVLADRALLEADQAGARAGAGDERPLLGVPIAVKDDQAVAGEVRTVGTDAAGGPERADAEVVRRLRAAGAIVIGITAVPELTQWGFTETQTFGVTRNPWDLARTPGGSSGGSGAAVAAGLVPAATASDGLGSIRIPAACCGLVGLKPQRGRVPTAPLAEPWHGMSVFGVLTRSVADTALVLGVLAERPYAAAAAPARAPHGLRVALSFAVPRESRARLDAGARRATEDVAELLRSLGHTVFERDPDYGTAALGATARYLRGITDDAAAMPRPERLERRTRAMARLGALVGRRGLAWARRSEAAHAAQVNAIFSHADVVLTPALAGPPIPVGRHAGHGALRTVDGQSRWAPPYTAVWNHVGNPALVLPAGPSAEGLPLGVQLVGPPDGEELLLALGAQLEAARPWADRRPPLATR